MLFEHVFENARKDPNRLFAIDDRGQYTTSQFAQMVAGLGMFFATQTKQPKIGLFLPTSVAFAASFYGALVAGKTVVPINFLLGEKEIGHIIKDSGIDLIVTAPPLAERIKGLSIKQIDLTTLPTPPAGMLAAMPPLPKPNADDLAVLMYTSGTSAMPKGVMLSYGNLDADVTCTIAHADLQESHRFLGVLPLFHSTGMLATLLAPVHLDAMVFYNGGRFSPIAIMKAIKDHNLSLLVAVPSMYGALARLKEAGPADFAHVYAVISGGEPCPVNIREGFLQKFEKPIYEGYGLTETIGPISFNVPQANRAGSVGKIIPKAEVKVVDDDGKALPQGQDGEVWLRGPMIMKGYNNLPEVSAEALTADGFFKTGDLGHVDADGFLFITGRKKDLIIVAGEKAVPREIEEMLLSHAAVAHAAVVGKKDATRGEVVVAFVVLKEGVEAKAETLKDHCRQLGLVQWKIPREVYFVPELPMSPTGKVLKRVLVEQAAKMD